MKFLKPTFINNQPTYFEAYMFVTKEKHEVCHKSLEALQFFDFDHGVIDSRIMNDLSARKAYLKDSNAKFKAVDGISCMEKGFSNFYIMLGSKEELDNALRKMSEATEKTSSHLIGVYHEEEYADDNEELSQFMSPHIHVLGTIDNVRKTWKYIQENAC